MKRAFKIGAGETCCGEVTDPYSRRTRREAGRDMVCGKAAHYDVDSKPYCAGHATTAALAALMQEERADPASQDLVEIVIAEIRPILSRHGLLRGRT